MTTETREEMVRQRPRSVPRRPSRGKGVARYEALVNATEALLQTYNPDAIGLYQIAEQAGVPPASVYHFFPTKEAAYQALAERDLEGLLRMHSEPIEARLLKGWQDLLANDLRRAMNYYNAHVPLMKVTYGGYGGVEARNIDLFTAESMADAAYARLNRIFHMPFIRDPAKRFGIRLAILDAIWAMSVREHGSIVEEYYDHSFETCVAYTRLFLPETLEPREYLLEAAARGGTVSLPYFQDEQASPSAA